MTLENLLVYGQKYIHKDHARIILADILELNPLELLVHLNDEVTKEQEENYKQKIEAIKKGIPIQYAEGYTSFYGNKLVVNKNVLIPRFETEELVENTLKFISKYMSHKKNLDIIDLGCGSGAIGLTLKQKIDNINTNISLLDISKEALEVAKVNANNLGLNVTFIENDMLDNITNKYDIIISNPPYIRKDEQIEEIVKNNEPHLALYAEDEGLYFYKKILSKVKENLNEEFIIAFEIGSTQKEQIANIVKTYLNNIKIICLKDMQERDRMLFIISDNLLNK